MKELFLTFEEREKKRARQNFPGKIRIFNYLIGVENKYIGYDHVKACDAWNLKCSLVIC